MGEESTRETPDEQTETTTLPRRSVLRATGVGAALPFVGGVAPVRGQGEPGGSGTEADDAGRPPLVHSTFGYAGTADDDPPNRLSPDETVELHVDEGRIDGSALPELTVDFGAFHFDPLGLHVEPGTVVEFDFETPEHSVTAYHPDQERQQRVPDGVPALTSPVVEHHGFWLYRFEEEGVYDLFCGPHEYGGMGIRIVVLEDESDDPGPVVRGPGRPPIGLMPALLGTGLPTGSGPDIGHPDLDPANVVKEGRVTLEDLSSPIDLEISITAPRPANPSVTTGGATEVTTDSATLNGTLHRFGAVDDGEVYFEYGEAGGNIDETSSRTTITGFDALAEPFSAEITGLDPDTEYAFRAVADADDGDSAAGEPVTFTTPS